MPLQSETLRVLQILIDGEKDKSADGEWSVRELLALSSAVLETGQEYWPTISRMVQPYGSLHRSDKAWCSSKECAKQYSKILDNITTKKRNENSNSSLPLRELIVKKLTVERIEELQDVIRKEQEKQIALKEMLAELESGKLDENVPEIWNHLHENSDFADYVAEIDKAKNHVKAIAVESETTDAMTSSCADEESNSDDNKKQRIVIRLKKSPKRLSDPINSDCDKDIKCLKVKSYQNSEDSCETEPAIDDSDLNIKFDVPDQKAECINTVAVLEENTPIFNKAWVKKAKFLLNTFLNDPNSHLFDSTLLMKHDNEYKSKIKKIINPIEIRNKLRDNQYLSPYEFEHDILLVFCNAVAYYSSNSNSNKIVREIYKSIIPHLKCLYESEGLTSPSTEDIVLPRTRKSRECKRPLI